MKKKIIKRTAGVLLSAFLVGGLLSGAGIESGAWS